MTTLTSVRPQRAPAPRLRIMADARPFLTPFRRRVLRLICARAAAELGATLKTATVSLWRSPEEDAQNLVLTLEADAGRSERRRVFDEIIEALPHESRTWSEAQREDFRHWIYFELGSRCGSPNPPAAKRSTGP